MALNKPVKKIAIVGTGVIGASWAAEFLAHGFDVVATDPVVRTALPRMFNPATAAGITSLNGEITRQASMVAYLDDFRLMLIITIACMPMLLLMRKPRPVGGEPLHAVID